MNREELILKAYTRGSSLTLENPGYLERVKAFTIGMVDEDVGEAGDITSRSVLAGFDSSSGATIVSKDSGVVAGVEEATWFYSRFGLEVEAVKKDGEGIGPGQTLFSLKGKCTDMLKTERTGLNLLQRMSGIATLTRQALDKVQGTGLHIAATRKTHWGALDNKAVAVAGGMTHRLGLWDSILIKENHLSVLKKNGYADNYVEEALQRAWRWPRKNFIEIEVGTPEEARRAAYMFQNFLSGDISFPCIIMLDNFSVEGLKAMMEEMKTEGFYPNMIFEASGSITFDNIDKFASTGVDVVSLGYLTHSPRSLDISQLHEYG
jgi:nicotinate-nucleotide pyrophosphorylase (carboxylating)